MYSKRSSSTDFYVAVQLVMVLSAYVFFVIRTSSLLSNAQWPFEDTVKIAKSFLVDAEAERTTHLNVVLYLRAPDANKIYPPSQFHQNFSSLEHGLIRWKKAHSAVGWPYKPYYSSGIVFISTRAEPLQLTMLHLAVTHEERKLIYRTLLKFTVSFEYRRTPNCSIWQHN